jgi:hypothetical protein
MVEESGASLWLSMTRGKALLLLNFTIVGEIAISKPLDLSC